MGDIFICTLIFLGAIPFFFVLGQCFSKNERDSFSYNFVLGYLIFTAASAVFGIIVQFLGLSWKLYFFTMIVLIAACIFLIIKNIRKRQYYPTKKKILYLIKNNYFLIFIAGALLLISLLYVWLFWANNHSDDGYYLNKIAQFPYISDVFSINVVTGFKAAGFDPYIVNTWEIEASFFSFIFSIEPTVYTRFFLNLFNNFLFLNVINALANKIFTSANVSEFYKKYFQFSTVVVLLFSVNSVAFEQFGLLQASDLWQFNSGMYLGSSVVRVCGLPILFLYFFDRYKIGFDDIALFAIISISLISKSTIAIPFIVLFSLVYLLLYLIKYKKNVLLVILLCVMICISLLLPNNENTENILYSFTIYNASSILIIYSIALFIISFIYKSYKINRMNIMIILIIALMFFNPLNNLFEFISVYSFVSSRMYTNVLYLLMALAAIYTFVIFFRIKIVNKIVAPIVLIVSIVFAYGSYKSFSLDQYAWKDPYTILIHNKKFIPESTINLSEMLAELSKEKELLVLAPQVSIVNGKSHTLSVVLRLKAQNIKVISAIPRFNSGQITGYENYSIELQDSFDEFSKKPNNQNINEVEKILNEFEVNCVIVENKKCINYLENLHYMLTETISDIDNGIEYYVFLK